MLTRGKKRAIAVQSQSAEGHEGSTLKMKSPSGWSELPAELLMMIFDNIKIEGFSKKQRALLLSCRAVHPRWKSAMDSLLEKRSLSFWRKGNSNQPLFNPYKFPVVTFHPSGKNILENVLYPSFLQEYDKNGPFPTKSVFLTTSQACEDNWVLSPKGDAHFFSKFCQHLTSLTIEELKGRKDFTAQTLRDLLTCTPHLKAMALQNVRIKLLGKDVAQIALPPLPHLEHVRLNCIDGRGIQFDAQYWILEPYKQQLINIACMEELGDKYANFPLLNKLQLRWPTRHQLLAPVFFPSLKYIDLIWIKLNENVGEEPIILENVFQFVSRVSDTLIELQIDITKDGRSKTNPINYENDQSLEELWEIQQNRFPTLKTLTIPYPMYEEEVKVVKDFLKMFPNLEILNFTRFDNYPYNPDHPIELSKTTARKHLAKEVYHEICSKLRTINVYMIMEYDSRPFLTSTLPFST